MKHGIDFLVHSICVCVINFMLLQQQYVELKNLFDNTLEKSVPILEQRVSIQDEKLKSISKLEVYCLAIL